MRCMVLEKVMDRVLDRARPCVSPYSSCSLDWPFNAEEIRLAVFAIGLIKALGPDGLPELFYQMFWDVVGPSVTKECLHCLNNECYLEAINDALVVLIPKVLNVFMSSVVGNERRDLLH
ncbi:hypothetical protein Ddye_027117 [Dipteronia dyeriana]|uniref:Uncharacterized protein n=1 Tax=Dipteronia dyeriana TaxID=168575 RepID=A0AAD9TNG8_9ROSI|nr:hypothetical protein Ddye_027117 [Dipteronia dyeriana]